MFGTNNIGAPFWWKSKLTRAEIREITGRMVGILIRSRSEHLNDLRKKWVQILEDMEEILIYGKFPMESTSPRFFIEREVGLMMLLFWQTKEPNHQNLEDLEETDNLLITCRMGQGYLVFMDIKINTSGFLGSLLKQISKASQKLEFMETITKEQNLNG